MICTTLECEKDPIRTSNAMTSSAAPASAEADHSRLLHREVTGGLLRPPLRRGGGRTLQQCPRADYRLPRVRKGCQTGPLRLQALSPRTGSDPVVVNVHTGPAFTMDAECAHRSIIHHGCGMCTPVHHRPVAFEECVSRVRRCARTRTGGCRTLSPPLSQ